MKRVIAVVLAVLLLGAVGGYFFLKNRGVKLVITQADIDTALKERFPVKKPFLLLFELVYSNPQVTLLPESQRVRVGLDAEVNVKLMGQPKKLGGGATLTGRVDYRPDTQEFFLADVQFERLAVDGLPPEQLQAASGAASKIAEEYVRLYPIYRLKADKKLATARLFLKNVEVRNREVVVTMGL